MTDRPEYAKPEPPPPPPPPRPVLPYPQLATGASPGTTPDRSRQDRPTTTGAPGERPQRQDTARTGQGESFGQRVPPPRPDPPRTAPPQAHGGAGDRDRTGHRDRGSRRSGSTNAEESDAVRQHSGHGPHRGGPPRFGPGVHRTPGPHHDRHPHQPAGTEHRAADGAPRTVPAASPETLRQLRELADRPRTDAGTTPPRILPAGDRAAVDQLRELVNQSRRDGGTPHDAGHQKPGPPLVDDARQHPDTGTAAPHPPEGSLRPATTEANSGAPLHGLQDHLVDGQRPDATASLANAAKDEHAAALQKDIDVGDDYDVTGWLEGAVRLGELTMTDVRSMVSSVLANAGREAIDRLDIRAHGNGTGVQIGRDWVTTANFDRFRGQLESLRGHFSPRGFVHLRACEVGQDVDLLRQFAQAFRVPVYAGTGAQNNILGFNTGRYVMVRPNGTWSYTRRP